MKSNASPILLAYDSRAEDILILNQNKTYPRYSADSGAMIQTPGCNHGWRAIATAPMLTTAWLQRRCNIFSLQNPHWLQRHGYTSMATTPCDQRHVNSATATAWLQRHGRRAMSQALAAPWSQ